MNYLKIFTLSLLIAFFSTSCKKTVPENQPNTLLYTEKIVGIKKGEPVSLTLGDDNIKSKVVWAIKPDSNFTINSVANNATIVFNTAGIYIVTATLGNVYAEYTITVDNIQYTPNYGSNFSMTAERFVNIYENEPVVFSVHNSSLGSSLGWSVFTSDTSNSYTVSPNNANKTATIIFNGKGYFVISADDGVDFQRRTVWVNSVLNSNPNLDTVPFVLGDKLQLKPSVEQTTNGKKLVITATTSKKYHCSTDKILSYNSNSEYIIDYSGVTVAPIPCNPRDVASCTNSFKNMQVGTHPFIINFGNKTYSGTVNLNALGTYTFTWANTSEVSVSPLVVN
jgi:hypothetical protein